MIEMIENTFAEMMSDLGYNAWYECDNEWERMENEMISMGLDRDEVRNFFREMEEEL